MNTSLRVPDRLGMPADVLPPKLLLTARWYHFIRFSLNNLQFLHSSSCSQASVAGSRTSRGGSEEEESPLPPARFQGVKGNLGELPVVQLHHGILAPFDLWSPRPLQISCHTGLCCGSQASQPSRTIASLPGQLTKHLLVM